MIKNSLNSYPYFNFLLNISNTTLIIITISVSLVLIALFTLFLIGQRKTKLKLEEVAYIDPLTKKNNLNKFIIDAEELLNKKDKTYVIWNFDIVNFGNINDIFGYQSGNLVLIKTSDFFANDPSLAITFSRVSGDNFVGLIAFDSKEDIIKKFYELSDYFKNFSLRIKNDLRILVKVGFYIYQKEDTIDIIEAISRAALAKKFGEGQSLESSYLFFSPEMSRTILLNTDIESSFYEALKNDDITFFLQPRINIQENIIEGAEALARWNHKKHGFLSPALFIPVLENTGQIRDLDAFIFESVCKWYIENQNILKEKITISLNISRQALISKSFVDYYIKTKDSFKIPNKKLELEFTETIAATDYSYFSEQITRLRAAGFLCAIDDFGTGYSSLNALKNLPIDVLKLDASFFRQSTDKEKEKIVVQSFVNLAKNLNIRTVAEGIEECRQASELKEMGIDVIQGYVFSKPLTKNDYLTFLSAEKEEIEKCILKLAN